MIVTVAFALAEFHEIAEAGIRAKIESVALIPLDTKVGFRASNFSSIPNTSRDWVMEISLQTNQIKRTIAALFPKQERQP